MFCYYPALVRPTELEPTAAQKVITQRPHREQIQPNRSEDGYSGGSARATTLESKKLYE